MCALISKKPSSDVNGAAARIKSFDSKLALPFLKRLLQLHGAGLAIGDTLRILQTRLQDPKLRDLAIVLWRDLSEGKSLGTALKMYPNIFGGDTNSSKRKSSAA